MGPRKFTTVSCLGYFLLLAAVFIVMVKQDYMLISDGGGVQTAMFNVPYNDLRLTGNLSYREVLKNDHSKSWTSWMVLTKLTQDVKSTSVNSATVTNSTEYHRRDNLRLMSLSQADTNATVDRYIGDDAGDISTAQNAWSTWATKAVSELPLGWNNDLKTLIPGREWESQEKPDKDDFTDFSNQPYVDQRIDNLKPLNLTFLPHYKSPCWYERVPNISNTYLPSPYTVLREYNVELIQKSHELMKGLLERRLEEDGFAWRLRCLPYFYVVASPRCGTSDLYTMLVKHKDVTRTLLKEEIYWNRLRYMKLSIYDDPVEHPSFTPPIPIQQYLELNDLSSELIRLGRNRSSPATLHIKVFGDVTPSYMFDFDAWRMLPPNRELQQPRYVVADLIHNVTPKAKIIFILRNPVDRLLSDYNFFNHPGLYRTQKDFHNKAMLGIKMMQDCFAKNTVEFCLHDSNTSLPMLPLKLRAGIYEPLLQEWFRVFPRDNTLVIKFEDYASHRKITLVRILRFLGLDESTDSIPDNYFVKIPSNQSSKRHRHSITRMYINTRKAVHHFYSRWNVKLTSLLRDDRFLWRMRRHTIKRSTNSAAAIMQRVKPHV